MYKRQTYTTAVKVCDVADDLGIADKQDFTTYTNGKAAANTDEVTINANATTATIGAQGRLTEVYEDTIVYIDTFLARVDKVTEVKYCLLYTSKPLTGLTNWTKPSTTIGGWISMATSSV